MTIEARKHLKAALRKEMRNRLFADARESKDLLTALNHSLSELHEPKRIAIFSPLPGEPDLTGLMADMPQHHWLFPRVVGEHLCFHRVENTAQQLQPGAFGILEPGSDTPKCAIADIEIFLCPGLAFDSAGGRLGRGRGFYDRVLGMAREDALKIGVGFANQLVATTYPETHDIPMNAVLCRG